MKRSSVLNSPEEPSPFLASPTQDLPQVETAATDLPGQLLSVLLAYKAGDFSVRLPADWTGVPGKIADAFNEIVEFNQRLSTETERVSRVVGKEGKLKQRLSVPGAKGGWATKLEAINTLIDDLVW